MVKLVNILFFPVVEIVLKLFAFFAENPVWYARNIDLKKLVIDIFKQLHYAWHAVDMVRV